MSGDGALEIIRGIERRRRWSLADKLRVVAEVEAPGAVDVAPKAPSFITRIRSGCGPSWTGLQTRWG